MKILSCYIAGFGRFMDESFDFTANPTIIKQDNGWGKTTLADFIRCMFYGHDAGRNKALQRNERAKYAPWRGGAYGGSLTFVYQNKKYRVERSFGKTPAYDVTRIYDQNNMQSFDFGDRGEKLGEILFGMDADGYRRSVYIPQGEICVDGMSDTMKNRLLSLLNTGGVGGVSAMEKLDEADRALRSKRRPAQGKLDKIDEKLSDLSHRKAECEYAVLQADDLRKKIAETEREMTFCHQRLQDLSQAIDRRSRLGELAAKKQSYDEAQAALLAAERELAALRVFFAGLDPATINLDGIQTAVAQYYDEKADLQETEKKRGALDEEYRRFLTLTTKKEGLEKTLDGYDEILDKKGKRKGAGTRRTRQVVTVLPPKRKANKWIFLIGVLLSVIGAVTVDKLLTLGLILLGLGVGGMGFVFFRVLPKKIKGPKMPKPQEEPVDPALQEQYNAALAELDAVLAEINTLSSDVDKEYLALTEQKTALESTLSARAQGIDKFLGNFKFSEIYDYRAAVNTLQSNITRYAALAQTAQTQKNRLNEFSQAPVLETDCEGLDMEDLQAQRRAEEAKRESLSQTRANALAQLENLAEQTDKNALNAEEQTLLEEKARLEKRHRAIVAAKQILLRAKENLAGKYLDPVEKGCRYYLQAFAKDKTSPKLHFSADGTAAYEETGMLRELGYYSEGMQELVGLCTRLAFVDAVFQKETPMLVLDDPFVNLDDTRTEQAKTLVKELAKKYQILYLTCKTERVL